MEENINRYDNYSTESHLPKFLRRKEKEKKIEDLNLTIHIANKEENKKQLNDHQKINFEIKQETSALKEDNKNDNFIKMLKKLKKMKKDEKIHNDISDLKVFLQEKFNLIVDVEDYRNYYNINEFDMCNCTGKKQHLLNCLINKKYNRFIEENIISKEMIEYQSWVNIRQKFYEYFPAKNIERNMSAKVIKREAEGLNVEKLNKTLKSKNSILEISSKDEEVKLNENLFSDVSNQINLEEDESLKKFIRKITLNEQKNEKNTLESQKENPDSRANLYKELVNKKLKIKTKYQSLTND